MSNTITRVIVGIIAIPILLWIIYDGGIYFFALTFIISAIALWEFYSMFQSKGFNLFKYTSIALSLLLFLLYIFNFHYLFFDHEESPVIFFAMSIVLLLIPLIVLEIFRKKEPSPMNIFISFMGFVYIVFPFLLMQQMVYKDSKNPNTNFTINIGDLELNYLIYIVILVWACDTFAYFGGKMFGKHQLSKISPKKTIEGSVIGFVFTVAISIIFHSVAPGYITIVDGLVIGMLVGFFAQAGDLFESLLKRYCGIKDSSHIIPGHGGVFDRFDSLIFVTPIIYLYCNISLYYAQF